MTSRTELTGWALVGPDGETGTIRAMSDLYETRSEAVEAATGFWIVPDDEKRAKRWRDLKRRGYSVRRVRVTVEVADG